MIMSKEQVKLELRRTRQMYSEVSFTNGCFDVFHAGHARVIKEAWLQTGYLIVAINSDESVRRLKGENRPINSLDFRLEVLESNKYIDAIIVFEADTPIELIRYLRPDVLVKGEGSASEGPIPGADLCKRLHLVPMLTGSSTTSIMEKQRGCTDKV